MQALHDTAAARTLAMSAVASPHAEAPPSLHSFLAARWAAVDQKTFALVMCVHASVLLKGALQPLELVTYRMLLAAHTACLALALAGPRAYLRHRSAIVSALRLVDVVLLPVLVDMHRIHQPASAATAVGAAAPPAVFNGSISSSGSGMPLSLHSLTMHGVVPALRAAWPHARGCLHAGLLFMVAVTRMHGCLAAAAGAPLPPALHLLLHAATVGALCMQSPTACRRYVGAANPHNALLVEGLFWVLRQVTSTLAVGSRGALDAAADAMSSSQKCVAVTWSLEISVGLVLLTLAVWRVQLGAAQKYVEGAPPGPHREAAEQVAARSQYTRLCAPALEAADSTGWALATMLTAVFGFVGGLLYAQNGV